MNQQAPARPIPGLRLKAGRGATQTPAIRPTPSEVVMLRIVLWLLLAAYLITVGLWPAALAPVSLAFAGAGAALAAIPGPVLLLAAVVAWLKHKPAPKPAAV